jgi:hypothetical protein
MDDKYSFVQTWLREIYKTHIPDVEVDSQTIIFLYELAVRSNNRNALKKIALDQIKKKIIEYKRESRIASIFCYSYSS